MARPSLAITVNGRIEFDNPFMLASGPPGTNGKVIAKSYDLGWGGAVTSTRRRATASLGGASRTR